MTRVMDWIDAWLPTDVAWRNHPLPLRMEEIKQDGQLIVRVEIPGIDPEKDIDIVIHDGSLTVSGRRVESEQTAQRSEFSYGEFMRMVTLPRGVDEESAKASYQGGILEITMATTGVEAAPRHVPIERTEQLPRE